jgi:hypothetical protein
MLADRQGRGLGFAGRRAAAASAVAPVNTGFEVELRESGVTVHVPPDQTILESQGHPVPFYFSRGDCRTCPLPIIEVEGEVEHRDHVLSDAEKAAGMFCVCVSRITGRRLVLDA